VIQRAEQVLKDLENSHSEVGGKKQKVSKKQNSNGSENMQLSFFQLNDPVLEQIHDELVTIDINTLTPVEALMKLHEIKKLTGG
jgi:DNA mismatch repair protein MutS